MTSQQLPAVWLKTPQKMHRNRKDMGLAEKDRQHHQGQGARRDEHPGSTASHSLQPSPPAPAVRLPQRMVTAADGRQKISPNRNRTVILAKIIRVPVTGMVRRFLKVLLSRSVKSSMAAMTPGGSSSTPQPGPSWQKPSKSSAFVSY